MSKNVSNRHVNCTNAKETDLICDRRRKVVRVFCLQTKTETSIFVLEVVPRNQEFVLEDNTAAAVHQ